MEFAMLLYCFLLLDVLLKQHLVDFLDFRHLDSRWRKLGKIRFSDFDINSLD
jgi:hypothetical protein